MRSNPFTFSLGGATVRLRVSTALFLLYGLIACPARTLTATLCALLLHEGFHLLAFRLTGQKLRRLDCTLFGGVIQLEQPDGAPDTAAFLGASAGVIGNLTAFLLLRSAAQPWLAALCRANLALAIVNLLPAYPLDGGRILELLLSRWIRSGRVKRALHWAGLFTGAMVVALSLALAVRGTPNLSMTFSGAYLCCLADIERRMGAAAWVPDALKKQQIMAKGRLLSVETYAAFEPLPLRELRQTIRPGRFQVLLLVDENSGKITRYLSDTELLEAALQSEMKHDGASVRTGAEQKPI